MTTSLKKSLLIKPKPTGQIFSSKGCSTTDLFPNGKTQITINNDHNISNYNPLPLSSPINAMLPNPLQTKKPEICEVSIVDFEFRPKHTKTKINTEVRWIIGENKTSHHSGIYSMENRSFVLSIPVLDIESDLLAKGEAFQHTFTEPGTYEVKCSNYPRMKGIIEVEEPQSDFQKVQKCMESRGLFRNIEDLFENQLTPTLPKRKKEKEQVSSPYKDLEEAKGDHYVKELLEELSAHDSQKTKKEPIKKREYQINEEENATKLFEQLCWNSQAGEDNFRNLSQEGFSDENLGIGDYESDKSNDFEVRNGINIAQSGLTLHQMIKLRAQMENSPLFYKKNKEIEENKSVEIIKEEVIIVKETPLMKEVHTEDILIEIKQDLSNKDIEKEREAIQEDMKMDVEVDVHQPEEKENIKEKKKNKHKKKKKKKPVQEEQKDENNTENKQAQVGKEEKKTLEEEKTQIEVKEGQIMNLKEINEIKEEKENDIINESKEQTHQEKDEQKVIKNGNKKQGKKGKTINTSSSEQVHKKESKIDLNNEQNSKREGKVKKNKIEVEEVKVDFIKETKKDKTNKEAEKETQTANKEKRVARTMPKQGNNTLPSPDNHNEKVINAFKEDLTKESNINNIQNKDKKKKKKKRNKRKETFSDPPNSNPQSLNKLPNEETTEPEIAIKSNSDTEKAEETHKLERDPFLEFIEHAKIQVNEQRQKSFPFNRNSQINKDKESSNEQLGKIASLKAFLLNRFEYTETFN